MHACMHVDSENGGPNSKPPCKQFFCEKISFLGKKKAVLKNPNSFLTYANRFEPVIFRKGPKRAQFACPCASSFSNWYVCRIVFVVDYHMFDLFA